MRCGRRCLFLSVVVLTANLEAQNVAVTFGEVSGQPGEIVAIPVRCTFDMTLIAAWIAFRFDPARIEPLEYSVQGTAAASASPTAPFLNLYQNQGMCGISIHERGPRPNPGSLQVPPGENVLIGHLRVRVRAASPLGRTPLPPAEYFRTTSNKTVVSFWENGRRVDVTKVTLSPEGGVTVTAPAGPRPVGDLKCVQAVDEALLTFTLTETYDSIEIRRNGVTRATIPGTQSQFLDPLGAVGSIKYAVVAFREGKASIPIECAFIATAPAAPGVTQLACGETGLEWENPIAFERILVFRSGEQLAVLAGTATSYVDPNRPPNVVVYSVVSEVKGYRSPDVNCVDNGVWVLEVQSVQAPVGATDVQVSVLATTAGLVQGFSVVLDIDQTRFALVQDPELSIQDTVLYPDPDWLVVNINPSTHLPTASVVFDLTPSFVETYKYLPPGLRQPVLNFHFTPLGAFSAGDSFPVTFVEDVVGGTVVTEYRYPAASRSASPLILLAGEIRFGPPNDLTVKRLKAAISAAPAKGGLSDVRLTWTNLAAYDAIYIERNGERIAALPGTAREYIDHNVESGVFTYKVIVVKAGQSGFPADVFVSTIPLVRTFLRCDANRDGLLDIADPIFSLRYMFGGGPAPLCADAADANDDGVITIADPIFSLTYLFGSGVMVKSPGAMYPWFDPTPDPLTCAW